MNTDPATPDVDEQPRQVRLLDPASIRKSPYQVRAEETPDDGLVASIATHGLLNPVTVREDEGGATFELIAGHRRLAAWILSRGSQPIPAIVLAADDMAAEDLLVSENFVRRDLTPIEQALTVKQLRDHGRTVDQTAAVVRKSTRWVQRFSAIAGIGQPWARHLAESRARCASKHLLPPVSPWRRLDGGRRIPPRHGSGNRTIPPGPHNRNKNHRCLTPAAGRNLLTMTTATAPPGSRSKPCPGTVLRIRTISSRWERSGRSTTSSPARSSKT